MIIIYVYYSSDMREFSLSDAIELSEYSYFNPMFLSTWAGPHHWKLKPHSSHDTIEVNENKIKKKKVVRKTLKVNLELVPSKDNFQKSKVSNNKLPKVFWWMCAWLLYTLYNLKTIHH
jgi:hypothetical protein